MAKRDKKKSKLRAEFRKGYDARQRRGDLTRAFSHDADELVDLPQTERVTGKGKLTRKRVVVADEAATGQGSFQVDLHVDQQTTLAGRVIRVHGLTSIVRTEQGDYECATRGLLKSLATDLQHVVVAGDHVTIAPDAGRQGVIVRVEPRRNAMRRTSKGKQQIIASNIDFAFIVTSAAEPTLKPNLVDRLLVTADAAGIEPVIVINKADLIDRSEIQPLIGVWGQLGYAVLQVSATGGQGIAAVRAMMRGRDSMVVGQSGVGKTSILNAVDPGLQRRVAAVSGENLKGRHTTTVAELIPLTEGGHVVDTPGIRQFQLYDVIPAEIAGHFRDLRVFVDRCRFPSCTHTHESGCGIRDAVADGFVDVRRYDSFCHLRSEEA